MTEAAPAGDPDASRHGTRHRGFRWGVASTLLELMVSVPTLAVEETWHGRPMIDQSSALWLVPAVLVAVAFVAGGAIAGYHLRPAEAATHATVAASLAVALLLTAEVIRRFWLAHESVPNSVARLWYVGAAVALLLSAAGSQLGRLRSLRTR